MSWTYAQVKDALTGAPDDPAEAADALNAETVAGPQIPVSVAAIHGVLMLAPTGDWLRIEALAAMKHSDGWPGTPTPQDAAISAAQLAVELAASKVTVIEVAKWPAFIAFLGGLEQAGAVSAETLGEIEALATPNATVPKWTPPLTAGDIQTARSQP